jgi:hypothetical protein
MTHFFLLEEFTNRGTACISGITKTVKKGSKPKFKTKMYAFLQIKIITDIRLVYAV